MANQPASGGTALAAWTDRVVLSVNQVFGDGDDVFLGQKSHSTNVASAMSYSDSFNVTISAGQSPGAYNLLLAADFFGNLVEENESNNVISQPITITP